MSGRSTDGTVVLTRERADSPRTILLVDDRDGGQARVLSALAEVVAVNDRVDESAALGQAVSGSGGAHPVRLVDGFGAEGAIDPAETWAIVNAPKATAALAETIGDIHALAQTVIVVGRSDFMSRAVNKELARAYARVDVSPGVGKHRLIIGSRPIPTPSLPSFPQRGVIDHPAIGPLQVRAHGACFSGVKPDAGSMLLLTALAAELDGTQRSDGSQRSGGGGRFAKDSRPNSVLDLGCGNGWLLCAVLTLTGAQRGLGVDVSRAAAASAEETLAANGLRATVRALDATHDLALGEDGSTAAVGVGFDLIVLNPPFHQGTSIETDTAAALMVTAAASLAPGGLVLTVFNSHLRYRDRLEFFIGPGRQLARNSKFTVVLNRPATDEAGSSDGERATGRRSGPTGGRR